MTGQYDRKAEGQALTDANTARLARDPFATSPAAAEYGFSELDPPEGPLPVPADDDQTRGPAITTLQEAGFGAPEILALLERAEVQGTIDRCTAGYTYRLTYTPAAGYQLFIYQTATLPQPDTHAQDCGLQGSGLNKSCTCHVDAADPAAMAARAIMQAAAAMHAEAEAEAETPAVCGADTVTGQCQRAPHGPEYPHVAGKYAAQADADLPNPAPPAVDLFRADWPYPVLTPVDFTALYQQAAETIKARGYYPHEASGYADEPGISITGALKAAATAYVKALGPHDTADQHYRAAADITEELETRLSAVLYVLGQVHTRTGISDLSDIHVGWSLAHFDIGPNPGLAAAVSLLEQAARMFAALEPVTEAPDPGRM